MTESGARGLDGRIRSAAIVLLVIAAVGGGAGFGALVGSLSSAPEGGSGIGATASPSGPATGESMATPSPEFTGSPTPEPTPKPTPVLVPAPLTGLPVDPEAAIRRPIAVMIDDLQAARPQSGFNAAAVVWQAPAEGGIPRYMLIFQDSIPTSVGPVRSARQYYVDWAAEWNAVYVHVGGSPGAMAMLRESGRGQLVWNADEFRFGGTYLWRVTERVAPHNVYTDGARLRALATRVGATDGPIEPAWSFRPDAPGETRPVGTTLTVVYPYETITFRYDPGSNTYRRYIDRATEPQVDAADGRIVAPSNVVILRMRFGALNDGSGKNRLEAADVGSGEAIVSTNGRIIRGSWSKDSVSSPTRLLAADGTPIALTAGQTFVQVIAPSYGYEIVEGTVPGDGIRVR